MRCVNENVMVRKHWIPDFSSLPGAATNYLRKPLTAEARKPPPENPCREHNDIQNLGRKKRRGTGEAPNRSS